MKYDRDCIVIYFVEMNSQYPHLYHAAERIEKKRMEEDLLYCIMMNPDTTKLNETVKKFVTLLFEKYPGASTRLTNMWNACITDNNRLLKHSLIFFCLHQEPFAVEYFMTDNKCPPDKISSFVSSNLLTSCDQLLKGSYTSLQSFVEDARWQYVVL